MGMRESAGSGIRAIIFDLDGTLLYTLPDIARAVNSVLERNGYPVHAVEEYRELVGHGLRESVRNALPQKAGRREEIVDRLSEELIHEYHRDSAVETVPYSGIAELLDYLEEQHIPAAVLTNKRQEIARDVVSRVLPGREFAAVLGDGGDFPRKPDPGSSFHLSKLMKVEPGEVLFLGDSGVDMETSMRAGMLPGGVLWGYKSREELERKGARLLFSAPEEIISAVSGQRHSAERLSGLGLDSSGGVSL
jgi:phosphoglycolate phosphatase